MHRCLRIAEILRIIARRLSTPETYMRKPDLLSMALTCHAFFDIAADVLWECIHGPEVLFMCLPDRVRGEGKYLYTIVKPPTQAEWQRFDLYARRVKDLDQTFEDFTSDNGKGITYYHISSWKSLKKYYPRSTPFPNLRSFRCSYDEAVGKLYEFIIPTTLQSFTIDSDDSKTVERACNATRICKESLKTFEIIMMYCPPDDLKRIVLAAKNLPSLQRLRVMELLPECLADIASMPRLETFSAVLQTSLPYTRGAVSNHELSALKDLDLRLSLKESGISSLLSFLGVCNFRNLTILTIRYNGLRKCKLNEAQDLTTELLGMVSNLEKIQTFKLQNYLSDYYHGSRGHTFDFHVLTRILSVRSLVELEIYHTTFTLSSQDVHTIARAWPKLRRLILGVSHHSTPPSYKPTLVPQDLLPFAVQCPDLEALGLPLKFPSSSKSPSDLEPPIPRVTNLRLRTLDCGDYPVKYSLGVATFLASVFPNATLLKSASKERKRQYFYTENTNVKGIDKINAKIASIVKQAREP